MLKTQKVTLYLVTILVASLLLISLIPRGVSATKETWTVTVPSPYSQNGMVQIPSMFPRYETRNFLYENQWLGSPGQNPWSERATLHAEAAYVKESATALWEDTGGPNWVATGGSMHITARNLRIWMSVGPLRIVEIAGESVEMDMSFHKPDNPGNGENYGTITATFKGNVKFHIPSISPFGAYDYEGPQLTVAITMYDSPPS